MTLAPATRTLAIAAALIVPGWTCPAQPAAPTDQAAPRRLTTEDLEALAWRSIGPANMSGRVAAIALAPHNAKTFYVGFATGGLWKTTNNGTTFSPVFDKEATSSIGSVAVVDAPPDWPGWDDQDEPVPSDERSEKGQARIVWVGTGEGNGRNSSSWGNGVYRSTDAGDHFTHLGLSQTHDIPAIAVDPTDPDTCFVAALGHLWGANEQRGVYKTSDGGQTWNAVLQIDENTGACDVVIDPSDPSRVYAAMYARRRTPWSYQSGGPEGGIYRSTDGGQTWTKLTTGLPERTGRIGLAINAANPRTIFATIESDQGGRIGDLFSNRSRTGGVYRSDDAGDTWRRASDFNPRAFYFSRIRSDPKDVDRVYLLGWQLYVSDDAGATFHAGEAHVPHVDFHTMAIDPDDTDHLLIGTDGGLYVSWDRGKTWDFHNHLAVGQFYNIEVDDSDPYRVGGGLQDNGSWIGPSESLFQEGKDTFMGRGGAITNHDWRFILGGDGFHVAFDPDDPNIVYAESQGGHIMRVHLDTGRRRSLRPEPKEGQPRFRFNWNAPFFISPHDPTTLYLGGNRVFRLSDRGQRWEAISPDLSRQDLDTIITVGSDAETFGTVVALAESPLAKGLIWAGTDDGLIHVTRDAGETWQDVTPEQVDSLYVACIEPSVHDASTAYAAIDGHRSDRFDPILLRTTDAGASWSSIVGDLPEGQPVKVVREDPENPDVLYIGTERSAFVSIDGGTHWIRINGKSLPTVAVDDLKVQRRQMDLVAGTHGRSIYILDDISPLTALTDQIVQSAFHVFEPHPARPRQHLSYGGLWSDRMFIADNPPLGGVVNYWIRDFTNDSVKLTIKDPHGHVVRKLDGTNRRGLNRVVWDLQPDPKQRLGNPHGMVEYVPAADYSVTVTLGDRSQTVTQHVLPEPGSGP